MTPTLPEPLPPKPPSRVARLTSPLAGIGLTAFMMVGLVTNIYAVADGELTLSDQPVTWSRFAHGAVMQDVANALARAPVPAFSADAERGVSWAVMGDLGPRVREGCSGWLFLNDERVPYPNAAAHADTRADTVIRVRDALAKKNIQLLVVTVPDKSRVLDGALCGLHRPAVFANRMQDFSNRLKSAGVPVVDTTAALTKAPADDLGTGAFLRTDTHWSEIGAAAAAQAVSAEVARLGVKPVPSQYYDVQASPPDYRPGDLVRLSGIAWLPTALQPEPEKVRQHRFVSVDQPVKGAGATAAAAPSDDDLFGDADLPNIAVIGTSFARTSQFVPYLERDLNTRVGNFARDGGDFAGAAQAYFSGKSFADTPPKLVIWEIPERTLQMPLNQPPITLAAKP